MSREIDFDAVVVVTAVVLLVGAVAVATVPGLGVLVPRPLRGFGEVFGASIASWVVGFALALAALVVLGQLKGRNRAVAEAETSEDDGGDQGQAGGDDAGGGPGSAGDEEIVGVTLTEEFLQRRDELRSRDASPDSGPTDGLERAAIAVQLARGHDPETAHERLRSGEWTDDPVAAAFLGDATAGNLSFRRRLYAVVYPDRAFERRFERTLEELEAAAERTPGIDGPLGGAGNAEGKAGDASSDLGGAEADATDATSDDAAVTDGGARTAGDAGGKRDGTGDGSDRAADVRDVSGGT